MFRETATAIEDLPHEYADHSGECLICRTPLEDARHVAWERARAAETEKAGTSSFVIEKAD